MKIFKFDVDADFGGCIVVAAESEEQARQLAFRHVNGHEDERAWDIAIVDGQEVCECTLAAGVIAGYWYHG